MNRKKNINLNKNTKYYIYIYNIPLTNIAKIMKKKDAK